MRFWILLTALVLTGCDNTTISASPNFSLFETSAGVVYLLNQSTGELKVISSKPAVINSGEVFRDGEGQFFKYLGNGEVEKVDGASPGSVKVLAGPPANVVEREKE